MDEENVMTEQEYQIFMKEIDVWIKQTNEFIKRNAISLRRAEIKNEIWKNSNKKIK